MGNSGCLLSAFMAPHLRGLSLMPTRTCDVQSLNLGLSISPRAWPVPSLRRRGEGMIVRQGGSSAWCGRCLCSPRVPILDDTCSSLPTACDVFPPRGRPTHLSSYRSFAAVLGACLHRADSQHDPADLPLFEVGPSLLDARGASLWLWGQSSSPLPPQPLSPPWCRATLPLQGVWCHRKPMSQLVAPPHHSWWEGMYDYPCWWPRPSGLGFSR